LSPGAGAVAVAGPLTAGYQQLPSQTLGIERPLEVLGYATMGERFLAFLCDASVESLLVGTFLAVFYLKSSLEFDTLEQLALWIIPIAYMTLSEFLFHGTIGKRLLRIQLLDDSPECGYPTLGRILLRESLGKFLCGLILGIGFLVAIGNPKKKTWADRMARTVVVKTGVVRGPLKALLVIVLICTYVGFAIALKEIPANYKKNIANQLETDERRINQLHTHILQFFYGGNPKSAAAYQQAMTNLSSTLDEYDHLLEKEQELVLHSRKLLTSREYYQGYRLNVDEKITSLRREIAGLARRHMQVVMGFDPQRQTWDQVLQDRLETADEIDSRTDQINKIKGIVISGTV
jgi:uncharacterized RDD family membrane protein YckC